MATIKIKLVKSTIGTKPVHRKNVEAIGLRKVGQTVEREDSPVIRGMIQRVSHLVEVEEK
ncbi:50S ribosomal protein L30 [Guggenheimella bovis]